MKIGDKICVDGIEYELKKNCLGKPVLSKAEQTYSIGDKIYHNDSVYIMSDVDGTNDIIFVDIKTGNRYCGAESLSSRTKATQTEIAEKVFSFYPFRKATYIEIRQHLGL